MLLELVITLSIALGTALLQTTMKGISRTNLPGKNHGLKIDDALFWSDWTIAGCLALVGSVAVAASQGVVAIPSHVWLGFTALALGCSVFPFFLRVYAYAPRAQLKSWGWRGTGWVLVANAVGVVYLLAAVLAGVDIYEAR
ncbi:hypothetical protein RM445_30745 [Pseudonocardia sp. DSM 45834]|uniref:Uncharacterized protein n=1 Tax=Pseudonocardia charpentierae TaxID=3075545 RepID=A0ABU2NLF9_9PSEU|nr:hypothetical protein [Pseudonocardia sp. DSM 45834]